MSAESHVRCYHVSESDVRGDPSAFSENTHLGQNYTFSQVSETTDQLKSSLVTINRVPLPTCSIATVSYWIQNGLSFFLSHELECQASYKGGEISRNPAHSKHQTTCNQQCQMENMSSSKTFLACLPSSARVFLSGT